MIRVRLGKLALLVTLGRKARKAIRETSEVLAQMAQRGTRVQWVQPGLRELLEAKVLQAIPVPSEQPDQRETPEPPGQQGPPDQSEVV